MAILFLQPGFCIHIGVQFCSNSILHTLSMDQSNIVIFIQGLMCQGKICSNTYFLCEGGVLGRQRQLGPFIVLEVKEVKA